MTALPPYLMTSKKGSFARQTIEERKPLIIDQILSDFDYTPSIREGLYQLKEELINKPFRFLSEETSDREIWDHDLANWHGKSWMEIPWFLAEAYFYRRVLEVVQYFQPGPWFNQDPYQKLKEAELFSAIQVLLTYLPDEPSEASLNDFQHACYRAMWGNRGDLSNMQMFETDMDAQHDQIILNHSQSTFDFLRKTPARIAYFMDNVGKEILFDLVLIDYILSTNLAESVTCYLKNQPFFVSDVMPKDLLRSIDLMAASSDPRAQELAQRLKTQINDQTITLEAPPFFTTGRMYRDMPQVLKKQVGAHDLVILKGDVNYRRLFGDRHWNPTTPVEKAADYFPTSFMSLRTLKGEIILGVTDDILENIKNDGDPDWLINGKRGMITFHEK